MYPDTSIVPYTYAILQCCDQCPTWNLWEHVWCPAGDLTSMHVASPWSVFQLITHPVVRYVIILIPETVDISTMYIQFTTSFDLWDHTSLDLSERTGFRPVRVCKFRLVRAYKFRLVGAYRFRLVRAYRSRLVRANRLRLVKAYKFRLVKAYRFRLVRPYRFQTVRACTFRLDRS